MSVTLLVGMGRADTGHAMIAAWRLAVDVAKYRDIGSRPRLLRRLALESASLSHNTVCDGEPRRNRTFNPQIKSRPPFVPVRARSFLFNDLRPALFPLITLFDRLSRNELQKVANALSAPAAAVS
jgi:hypothetical protein